MSLERCAWRTYIKTYSWKSKMKHVVEYDFDILLTVSIYVTIYVFSNEHKKVDPSITAP